MPTAQPSRGRVLLVDDDRAITEIHASSLREIGYEVETCTSGEAALPLVTSSTFDVLVTDLGLPGMPGMELVRRVRELDAELSVVIVTGNPQVESAAQAIDHGVLKYFTKPVALDALHETIRRAAQLSLLGRVKRETLQATEPAAVPGGLEKSFDRCMESLWVAFQPIVSSENGSLFGYEALLRSREPELPHPGAVLDAAERLGRTHDVGRRVRELAFNALASEPRTDFSLFLNLHSSDLLDDQLFTLVESRPEVAKRLVLEVTERSSLDHIPDARVKVAALRAMGCRVAIDDLGAGYAGLTSFVQLEPDIVKLDMSLVRDADKSPLKQKLIGSLTNVCRDLELLIVAEGIETAAEREVVVSLHCHLLQGYLFGKPGPGFGTPKW